MDALLSKNTKSYLPLIEQAERKQLPDYLSIPEIVELQYPKTEEERTDRAKRQVLNADRRGATEALTDACNNKLLKFSLVKKETLFIPDSPTTYYDARIIHKDDLKTYLLEQEGKPWTVIVASFKGLLANWWPDKEDEELSISAIINYWFRYEPKEETPAAKRKCNDEKRRVRGLLNGGVDSGKLKARIETKEIKQDVHPNSFTGEHTTENERNRYGGYAYTKVSTVKTAYIALNDLARFLRSINKAPPEDSPLMTDWLAKWWLDDEPQSSGAGNIDKLEAVAADDEPEQPQADFDKRLAVLQSWLEKQKYYVSGIITTLPKGISHNKIHTILDQECKNSPLLDSSLFDLTLESFVRHFWTPQKIARLKPGR